MKNQCSAFFKILICFITSISIITGNINFICAHAASQLTNFDKALLSDNSSINNLLANVSADFSYYAYELAGIDVEDELIELGFHIVKATNYPSDQTLDEVSYTIAQKEIKADGTTYHAYGVIIRGTQTTGEWISNFDVNPYITAASGFSGAANKIIHDITSTINHEENNVLWITGHSRGAGVANYIAGMMMLGNAYVPESRIHAYTFACPNTTKKPNTALNIYNFNFEQDIVGYVPLSQWGFGRNGKTITNNSVYTKSVYLQKNDIKQLTNALYIATGLSCEQYYKIYHNLIYDINELLDSGDNLDFATAIVMLLNYCELAGSIIVLEGGILIADALLKGRPLILSTLGEVHAINGYQKWIYQSYKTNLIPNNPAGYPVGNITLTDNFAPSHRSAGCTATIGQGVHYCCYNYAMDAYVTIWGTSPAGTHNNQLRNVAPTDRKMSVINLAKFFAQAEPGAVFRMDEVSSPEINPYSMGHNMIFLELGEDGAWFWEGNYDARGNTRIHYWTWEALMHTYGHYTYIQYIKWPNATAYVPDSVTPQQEVSISGASKPHKQKTGAPFEMEGIVTTTGYLTSVSATIWNINQDGISTTKALNTVSRSFSGNATISHDISKSINYELIFNVLKAGQYRYEVEVGYVYNNQQKKAILIDCIFAVSADGSTEPMALPISITRESKPSQLKTGSPFEMEGIVTTSGYLSSISATIWNIDQNGLNTTKALNTVTRSFSGTSTNSHDISKSINYELIFNMLKAGQYRYEVEAIYVHNNQQKKALLIDSIFAVSADGSTPPLTPPKIGAITLFANKVDLEVATTTKLQAAIYPPAATQLPVVWQSSNPDVATVNANGVVLGLNQGSAWISCSSKDMSVTSEAIEIKISAPIAETLPGTVTISKDAFAGCVNLQYVYMNDYSAVINDTAFDNCASVTIICDPQSDAEYFATKNGIPYVLLEN